jgi:hypothetical protein
VSGLLGAVLLVVGGAVRATLFGRVACLVLVAVGFVALGTLGRAQFGAHPDADDLVMAAVVLAFLLIVLTAVASSARRLWRLWTALVFLLALFATAVFAVL